MTVKKDLESFARRAARRAKRELRTRRLNHRRIKFPRSWPPPARTIGWIRAHENATGGILVHSRDDDSYPEVTGYLIPTLLKCGEKELAERLTRWLICIQRADGCYTSPQGQPYVFDTGQALRDCSRLERSCLKH